MEYRILEKEFESKGIKFKQLKRIGDVAMYELTKKGKVIAYEPIQITRNAGGECYGKMVEPYEVYPGDAMFGKTGYYCVALEQAERRFAELLTKQTNRIEADRKAREAFLLTGEPVKRRGRPKKVS